MEAEADETMFPQLLRWQVEDVLDAPLHCSTSLLATLLWRRKKATPAERLLECSHQARAAVAAGGIGPGRVTQLMRPIQRPRRLITDGLFALSRNPNYFGEMLIYASFCLLAQHWLPWVACAFMWCGVFLVNMLRKERSMSRYPEHAAWRATTGFVVPSLRTLLRRHADRAHARR